MRVGDVLQSRFEIVSHCADGGMGTVYQGRDRDTGCPVAVKVLTRTTGPDVHRFEREVKLLKRLAHPRIVCYVAAGTTDDGARYLVQEWVEGVQLRDYMEQRGLTPAEAVVVARNLAEALAAAHAAGVVHRDVKPSNVILERGALDRLRLLDFGVARELAEAMPLTRTGTMVGTPSYMAPEQARGAPDIDARADVFALGCLLYEGLTGARAFPGGNPIAIRAKVLMCRPVPLARRCPDTPRQLASLVDGMLAKNPDARPRDAAAVLAALSRLPALPDAPRRTVDPAASRYPAGSARTDDTDVTDVTQELTCVVFAVSSPAADDDATVSDLLDGPALAGLRDALARLDAGVERLADGAVVVTLASEGDPRACAERAARAAIVLRRHLPDAAVALGGCTPGAREGEAGSLDSAIDWGARTAEAGLLDAIFADYRPDQSRAEVTVDDIIARLLPAGFRVDRRGGEWVLSVDGAGDDATVATD